MHPNMHYIKLSDTVGHIEEGVGVGLQFSDLVKVAHEGLIEKVVVSQNDGAYRIYADLRIDNKPLPCALVCWKGNDVRAFKKPMTYAKLLKRAGIEEWTTTLAS